MPTTGEISRQHRGFQVFDASPSALRAAQHGSLRVALRFFSGNGGALDCCIAAQKLQHLNHARQPAAGRYRRGLRNRECSPHCQTNHTHYSRCPLQRPHLLKSLVHQSLYSPRRPKMALHLYPGSALDISRLLLRLSCHVLHFSALLCTDSFLRCLEPRRITYPGLLPGAYEQREALLPDEPLPIHVGLAYLSDQLNLLDCCVLRPDHQTEAHMTSSVSARNLFCRSSLAVVARTSEDTTDLASCCA